MVPKKILFTSLIFGTAFCEVCENVMPGSQATVLGP